ncbi:hypothetical protein DES53_107262 [Roseimicrobium gellanilyticum]|uniref:Uncharacterized protein n=1 Tax=Roseimicrobium gellanilyticum TaxID=748857 RepID=A0A366HH91_9BACT|nr:hypothetical protein [Roseimicrobium gellanilyticum]RBP41430.1 hypothetical protein DES53_107262 [Roseimicrobium gellanilyticum]
MTGKELWAQYQVYTRDLTEHGRTLGFAGVGICWLFKDGEFTFPLLVYVSLSAFVSYFICDILQPLLGALSLKRFTEKEEERLKTTTNTIEGEIEKPRSVDRPAYTCFLLKTAFLVTGFLIVGAELARRLWT